MSGRHKFKNLIEQLPPERREAIAERTAELLAAMPSPQTEEEDNQTPVVRGSRQPRDTYRYQYKVDNKVSHVGITHDPARREAEHQQEQPGGRIVRQGPRVTRASA